MESQNATRADERPSVLFTTVTVAAGSALIANAVMDGTRALLLTIGLYLVLISIVLAIRGRE